MRRGSSRRVRIPVTVKIRSGWDDASCNAVEVARWSKTRARRCLRCTGARACSSTAARPTGSWWRVRRTRCRSRSSAAATSAEPDPCARAAGGGYADGVMIGRGAIADPWIFAEFAAAAGGRPRASKPRVRAELVPYARPYSATVCAETLPDQSVHRALSRAGLPDGEGDGRRGGGPPRGRRRKERQTVAGWLEISSSTAFVVVDLPARGELAVAQSRGSTALAPVVYDASGRMSAKPAPPMDERYEIYVSKDYFKFNAAHFMWPITGSASGFTGTTTECGADGRAAEAPTATSSTSAT